MRWLLVFLLIPVLAGGFYAYDPALGVTRRPGGRGVRTRAT